MCLVIQLAFSATMGFWPWSPWSPWARLAPLSARTVTRGYSMSDWVRWKESGLDSSSGSLESGRRRMLGENWKRKYALSTRPRVACQIPAGSSSLGPYLHSSRGLSAQDRRYVTADSSAAQSHMCSPDH